MLNNLSKGFQNGLVLKIRLCKNYDEISKIASMKYRMWPMECSKLVGIFVGIMNWNGMTSSSSK